MRVAIFGYVKRAFHFAAIAMPFEVEVEWFDVGGMTTSQPCPNLISRMVRYSPDIVVVC